MTWGRAIDSDGERTRRTSSAATVSAAPSSTSTTARCQATVLSGS